MRNKISFGSISLRHFLVSTVIPILILFLSLSWYDTRQAFFFTQEVYAGTLETSAGTLNASFSELEEISFTPYLYKDILQAMLYMYDGFLSPDNSAPEHLQIDELETNYVLLFTKLLHSARQKVLSISFYPLGPGSGSCFSIQRNSAGLSYTQIPASQVQALYEQTIDYGSRPVFLSLDNSGSPAPVFSLLRTIKDYDSGKELGVLRIDARSDVLGAALDGIILAKNGYVYLTDSCGNLICQSGEHNKRISYATQLCPVGNSGWALTLCSDRGAFRLSNLTSVLIIFLVTLMAYLFALILYRVRSEKTISSIDSILFAIQQLQQGNLNYHCQVKDDQELKLIADALNDTGHKLDTLIHTEAEARAARFRAEYLALQTQINPHFLSNILNNFIALNRMGERQLLENSIVHLTKLFRYICSNSDTASVEQEANFIVQYLELQKLRYEDRIEYQVSIAPEAAGFEIPKLIVQPLVENCIVHGMREDDSPLLIQLTAVLDPGSNQLILTVADNGIGFDTTRPAARVGLDNVSKRLAFFHPDAQFQIESTPRRGTTVRLMVPISAPISRERLEPSC